MLEKAYVEAVRAQEAAVDPMLELLGSGPKAKRPRLQKNAPAPAGKVALSACLPAAFGSDARILKKVYVKKTGRNGENAAVYVLKDDVHWAAEYLHAEYARKGVEDPEPAVGESANGLRWLSGASEYRYHGVDDTTGEEIMRTVAVPRMKAPRIPLTPAEYAVAKDAAKERILRLAEEG